MNILDRTLRVIIGKNEDFNFEERLVLSSIIYVGTICFVSIFGNIHLGLSLNTILIVVVSFLTYLGIYILSRFFRKTTLAKWLFNIYTFLFCDFYWFINYGSKGSALFIFLIYSTILVYLWKDKYIRTVSIILFVNIIALFLIEYNYPSVVSNYPNEEARLTDTYSGLFIVLGYCILVGVNAKRNYIRQYLKAQHSDNLKSSFLANISHEIRTPLNAILGFSHLLTYTDLEKSQKEKYAELIHENGNYLTRLVSDILDVSMLESGQLTINKSPFDLNNLINKLQCIFERELVATNKDKKIEFIIDIPSEAVKINQDEFRVEQILSNLLSNAVKFTVQGHIKLGYTIENKYVKFFIEDTGRGIKKEYQHAIFDRFVKFDDGVDFTFVRGAGIGLSLAKELTTMLNGRIEFKSTYLAGSTFYVNIPIE